MNRFTVLFLICLFISSSLQAEKNVLNFIFCSDLHYGIQRNFRGKKAEASQVNQELFKAFQLLPYTKLPSDGGVKEGEVCGTPEFIICTGDIANRMQKNANKAAESWKQFEQEWISQTNIPIYLVPGNHDISNAIGHPKGLDFPKDATSALQIFNRTMHSPSPRTAQTFDYSTDKVHYSLMVNNLRFIFLGIWPDQTMRQWMDSLFIKDNHTPTLIFTHDPVETEAKHFTNPNPPYDINSKDKFENLLADTCCVNNVKEKPLSNWHELEVYFQRNPQIKAYFHGDYNYNEFYDWHGTDGTICLPVFRVDSPMKGAISSKDESLLSFIIVSVDFSQCILTARECLWNKNGKTSISWGENRTIRY